LTEVFSSAVVSSPFRIRHSFPLIRVGNNVTNGKGERCRRVNVAMLFQTSREIFPLRGFSSSMIYPSFSSANIFVLAVFGWRVEVGMAGVANKVGM